MTQTTQNIPQGYKQTPVGIIPEHWEVKMLKKTGQIITGSTPSTSVKEYYNGEELFVSPVDINENVYILDTEKKLTKKGLEQGRLLARNSILFVCIGSTIGKVAISGKELITNQQINSIIPNNKTQFYFLYNQLKYNSTKIKLLAANQAVPILNKSEFSKIKLPIPPLSEQEKIADCLTTWDTAIEKLSDLIKAKKQYKKGLMQQLLTGKKRLDVFTDEWKEVKLGNIAKIIKGEQLNRKQLTEKGSYPSYSGGVTPSGYTDEYNCNENSIIISEGGNSCGYVNFITKKFWLGGHCYHIEEQQNKVIKYFLYCQLKFNQPKIMLLRVGSGLPNIQKRDLSKYKLYLPSIAEQTAIAEILSTVDKEIRLLEEKLVSFKTQKKGLMQVLLTGKKRLV